jgi:hypothetical protein
MKIVWPMTFDTFVDYEEICEKLQAAAADQDLLRYNELKDALQSLPGFPTHMTELDTVVPQITTERALTGRVSIIRPSSTTIH